MDDIVVIGGGGHARVVISIINRMEGLNLIGYVDPVDHGDVLGAAYLGDDTALVDHTRKSIAGRAALGIGMLHGDNARTRERIMQEARAWGFVFPAVCSPNSVVNEEVSIGEGTLLCDGTVINSMTRIGEGVIINTSSSVDHDCVLGNHVHVAPGVTLSGGVTIGDYTMIGAGSTIVENKTISANVLIGAGSTVVRDLTEPGVYFGNPARRMK